MKNPQTNAEWQEAADAAQGLLILDAARHYGLITGGPTVAVERCAEIIRCAKRLGIHPAHDCAERIAIALSR